MVKEKCLFCRKEFVPRNANQKCCCKLCCKRKNRKENYKSYTESDRRWQEKNRDKMRASARRSYSKNKEKINGRKSKRLKEDRVFADKAMSRSETRRVIQLNEKRKLQIIDIPFKCKSCGEVERLELHHEIYPRGVEAIRKAIREGKIYYSCRKCHGKKSRKKL